MLAAVQRNQCQDLWPATMKTESISNLVVNTNTMYIPTCKANDKCRQACFASNWLLEPHHTRDIKLCPNEHQSDQIEDWKSLVAGPL